MRFRIVPVAACALLCASLFLAVPARAEVVEEIVAWVGGEIITRSELEQIEEEVIADLYSRFTGEELDQQVKEARATVLQQLIDQKILYLRAARLFDLKQMEESLLDYWMEQQNIENVEELERLLTQEGMTLEAFKKRIMERFAPDEVLRLEVGNRISVGDAEVEEFYNENLDQFAVDAEISLREIVLLAQEDSDRDARRTRAEEIRAEAVKPGADFAALATEHSEAGTRENGGLLGPMKKSDLSEQLVEEAFALSEGETSAVLEMPYGFHIIRVESLKEAHTKPLEEVSDQLKTFLENKKYFEGLQTFLKRARGETDWRVNPKYQDRL